MKSILLYILLIIVFCCLFIITQKVETNILYLGLADSHSGDIIHNHKTSIQVKIFVYLLAISLTILSFSRIVKQELPKVWIRLVLSYFSISIIYYINYLSSESFPSEGFNIYYDWRHNLGVSLATFTIIINSIMMLIVGFLSKLNEWLSN